jgi:hypothetical protein
MSPLTHLCDVNLLHSRQSFAHCRQGFGGSANTHWRVLCNDDSLSTRIFRYIAVTVDSQLLIAESSRLILDEAKVLSLVPLLHEKFDSQAAAGEAGDALAILMFKQGWRTP